MFNIGDILIRKNSRYYNPTFRIIRLSKNPTSFSCGSMLYRHIVLNANHILYVVERNHCVPILKNI